MASLDELDPRWRLLLQVYPWRRIDPVPWTPLGKPLSESRVAIITSAGFYRPGVDEPFGSEAGGDVSFRALPVDTPLERLALGQTSHTFDRQAVIDDPASALPIPHLEALVDAGRIRSVAPRAISFNGSILAPGRLLRRTGPAVAAMLTEDRVDAALFVPV